MLAQALQDMQYWAPSAFLASRAVGVAFASHPLALSKVTSVDTAIDIVTPGKFYISLGAK